jgi:hypothetical protein
LPFRFLRPPPSRNGKKKKRGKAEKGKKKESPLAIGSSQKVRDSSPSLSLRGRSVPPAGPTGESSRGAPTWHQAIGVVLRCNPYGPPSHLPTRGPAASPTRRPPDHPRRRHPQAARWRGPATPCTLHGPHEPNNKSN